MSSNLYRLLPLPSPTSIRLLSLVMNPESKIVECTLDVHDLHSAPQFAALSYTWGKQSDEECTISCNKINGVQVGPNLREALLRLRRPSQIVIKPSASMSPDATPDFFGPECHDDTQTGYRIRRLWIDSLCIDQKDNEEKAQQVRLMGNIYSQAVRVIAWLEDSYFVDHTLAQMLVWASVQQLRLQSSQTLEFDEAGMPEPGSAIWDNCLKLFQNEYFERVWVIQELVLAKSADVFMGNHEIAWPILGAAAAFFMLERHYWEKSKPLAPYTLTQNPFSRAHSIWTLYRQEDEPLSLHALLCLFHSRKATVKQDKVFGLLGLCSQYSLEIDYKRTGPEVFRHTARVIIQRDDNLDVLSSVPWTQFHRGPLGAGGPAEDTYTRGEDDPEAGFEFTRRMQAEYTMNVERNPLGELQIVTRNKGEVLSVMLVQNDPDAERGYRLVPREIYMAEDLQRNYVPYAEIPSSENEPPSSWAPDWIVEDFGPEVRPILHWRAPYNAAGDLSPRTGEGKYESLLNVEGVYFDTIETCSPVTGNAAGFYFTGDESRFPNRLKELFEDSFQENPDLKGTPEERKWAFAMTMVAGTDLNWQSVDRNHDFKQEAAAYWESILGEQFLDPDARESANAAPGPRESDDQTNLIARLSISSGVAGPVPQESEDRNKLYPPSASTSVVEDRSLLATSIGNNTYYNHKRSQETCAECKVARNYCGQVWSVNYRRRMFRTKTGHFGLGSSNITPGDQVVVLFGGKTPFVLRQKEGYYRLISDCYVHGIMSGELVTEWKKGELQSRIFSIL